jgi:hypothetical protein
MNNNKKSISTNLGHIFAYLQSTIDTLLGKGFEKIDEYSTNKQIDSIETRSLPKKIAFWVLGFVGNTGKAYYQKYTELSKKKSGDKVRNSTENQ